MIRSSCLVFSGLLCGALAACTQQHPGAVELDGASASDASSARDTSTEAADSPADVEAEPDAAVEDPSILWREGDCAHPRVEKQCKDGWCAIPAGCFIIGSPEGEWDRGKYTEDQVPVTLTRPFFIQQHEFTYGEWSALGLAIPTVDYDGDCTEPTCPLGNINAYEAVFLANLASEKHTPPLPACYKLDGCAGVPGDGVICKSVELTTPTIYACEGFRLPTEAEWEYAARAGTRTAYYNGGFAPETTYAMAVGCEGEKNLDPIAWNCANAGGRTHPVGQKLANDWGLYDMIGNASEWTNDHMKYSGYGTEPLTDPEGQLVQAPERVIRGGGYTSWPTDMRAADHDMLRWENRGPGVRLVRSGSENPGALLKAPLMRTSPVTRKPVKK